MYQSTGSVGRGGSVGPREESKLEDSSLTQKHCHHPHFLGNTLLPPGHRSWTFILDFLASLSQMEEDVRATWHGRSGMLGWVRAPSSPLLLNLGLMLTAICLLLLYNCFGNKSIRKKTLPGTHDGQMCVVPKGFARESREGVGTGRDAGFDTHPGQ